MAVIDGTSRLRKVLMCRPDFLVSAAPINVISEQYTEPLDHDKMMQEYGAVVKAYQDNGVEVVQVTSGKKCQMQFLLEILEVMLRKDIS
ncbi:aminohydrolase [Streptococcus infantarius subsp. infantarius]|nr:aminohydrolase [Streptococcus infantarius subsp. infantarius]